MRVSPEAEERVWIFGVNAVWEKLRAAPEEIDEIVIASGERGPRLRALEERAKSLGLQVRRMEAAALRSLAGAAQHQGVVAKVLSFRYFPFDNLLRDLSGRSEATVLAVDSVADPRNLGALLRTAEAAGVEHVVIPTDRAVGVTPAVIKTSAGAAHYLKICRVTNLRRALGLLKRIGCWVVALDPGAAVSVYQQALPEKMALVVGAEGKGIRPLVLRECDFTVSIPMRGQVQSLNVAVAAGVALYEAVRQRTKGGEQRGG